MMMESKAVFLDRDGVINEEGGRPVSVKELKIVPEAIRALKLIPKEYKKIIVTNQSWVSHGLLTEKQVQEVHEAIKKELSAHGVHIDGIYFCPHYHEDDCECRKPKPGMLLKAQKEHRINLKESYMIGDMLRDIEAGKLAGCKKSILIKRDHSHYYSNSEVTPDHTVKDVVEAVKMIFPG